MTRPATGHLGRTVIVAFALIGLASACTATTGAGTDYVASGDPVALPASELPAADEATFGSILVGQRGRPVVVNVWASWCGPCRVEAPLLQRAADEYGDRVAFLGVASRDERTDALEFLDRYGIRYPNVFDESGDIRRALGLQGFPTTYIFDVDGVGTATVVGGIGEQQLAAQLEDLLG
jgi:cytochrome c biogenesis protein CcmG/thiol:disulfide interchange protein DsbE